MSSPSPSFSPSFSPSPASGGHIDETSPIDDGDDLTFSNYYAGFGLMLALGVVILVVFLYLRWKRQGRTFYEYNSLINNSEVMELEEDFDDNVSYDLEMELQETSHFGRPNAGGTTNASRVASASPSNAIGKQSTPFSPALASASSSSANPAHSSKAIASNNVPKNNFSSNIGGMADNDGDDDDDESPEDLLKWAEENVPSLSKKFDP